MNTVVLSDILTEARSGFWGHEAGTVEVDALVIRNGDVQEDGLRWDALPLRGVAQSEYDRARVRAGDIVLTTSGDCGFSAYISDEPETPTIASNFVRLLRFDERRVFPRYAFHLIHSDTFRRLLAPFIRGTTLENLSLTNAVERVTLPLPFPDDPRRSLAEQKRIAAILDKADAIRRRRQEAVTLLRELRTSLLLEAIGDPILNKRKWTTKPFEEVLSDDRPITYGILKPGDHHPEGVPMVRIQDVSDGEIVEQSLHRVSPELSDQYRRTILKGGEIVISLVGTIGVVGRVPKSLAGANLHRNLGLVVPSPNVNDEYLYELMLSPVFKLMLVTSTKGGIQSLLNLGDLSKVKLPVPPREVQDRFAWQVLAVRRRLEEAKAAEVQGEALLNSLVQRAFRGEL